MYTDWFQLAHKPFAIAPDPRFLYLSERHRDALAHLLFGVNEGGGFILLTGEVGTGKTMLTRTLFQQMPDDVDAALVFNPRVSLVEFLELICDELRVQLPAAPRTPKLLTDALNRYLLDAHARGRRTVLIIDEAQNLDPELLEQVRLLTNLETDRDKLLQILLVGQPELRDTLARPELRQVAQRITARFHLDPLYEADTFAYVRHRLEVAGARQPLFTRRAIQAVHDEAGGIPRLVNVICDRALLGAWANRAHEVDVAMVRRAADEVRGDMPRRGLRRPIAVPAAVSLAALLLLAAGWYGFRHAPPAAEPLPEPAPVVETAPADDTAPAPEPAPEPGLAEILVGTDAGLRRAAEDLLAAWDLDGDDGLPGSLCRIAQAAGLACLREHGDWNSLRALDRPAMLDLVSPSGEHHTVLLQRLGDDNAHVLLAGESRAFPLDEIGAWWYGEYLALWPAAIGGETLLRPGMEGEAVRELRARLDAALGPDERSNSGYYGAGLEARVREFQARENLEVDGIAGERTLLALDPYAGGPRILDVTDT